VATWSGWQAQLLNAAGLPTAEGTQEFLFDWSQHADSNCRNNPVDISHARSGATNCHKLTATRTAKNYTSHGSAASAFSAEIHSGNFPALLRALNSAVPYQQPDPSAVVSDLRQWGSAEFASYYAAHSNTGTGGGQGSGGGAAQPHVHKGWADLRRSINHNMPKQLARAQYLTRHALRATSHGGKVKR